MKIVDDILLGAGLYAELLKLFYGIKNDYI